MSSSRALPALRFLSRFKLDRPIARVNQAHSNRILHILSNFRHPLHPLASEHFQFRLAIAQVNPVRVCKEAKLQASRVRVRGLNDAHWASTLSTHGPLHGLAAAGIDVHKNLVDTARWAHSGSRVGSRVKLDVLLGHDEGITADST